MADQERLGGTSTGHKLDSGNFSQATVRRTIVALRNAGVKTAEIPKKVAELTGVTISTRRCKYETARLVQAGLIRPGSANQHTRGHLHDEPIVVNPLVADALTEEIRQEISAPSFFLSYPDMFRDGQRTKPIPLTKSDVVIFQDPKANGVVEPEKSVYGSHALLAFHLIRGSTWNPQTLAPFATIEELQRHAETARTGGVGLYTNFLKGGFVHLTAEATVARLIKRRLLTEDELGNYYETCARWLVDTAEYEIFTGKERVQNTLPYLIEKAREEPPAIGFLPVMAQGYLRFIKDVYKWSLSDPDSYPLPILIQTTENFFIFTGQTLKKRLPASSNCPATVSYGQLLKAARRAPKASDTRTKRKTRINC